MKDSDVITRDDIEMDVVLPVVDAAIARVMESYDGNDVVELAALFDEELRKDGIAVKFAWLWSRASIALN